MLKEKIAEMLERQFGVKKEEFLKLKFEFEERGKRRVYMFGRCDLNIPRYHEGLYFGTLEENGIRLSIEGCYIVGGMASKNVVEVNDDLARDWMMGKDIPLPVKGYVILKWGKFFLGCGKGNGRFVKNFVPKERRIHEGEDRDICNP